MTYFIIAMFIGIIMFILGCVINWMANKLSEKPSRFAKLAIMVIFVAIMLTAMAYAE